VISRSPSGDLRWWTWAGDRANATLKATLGGLADQSQRIGPGRIRLRGDLRPDGWRAAVRELADHLVLPDVDDRAVHGLKFSAALPRHLAEATLAARLADLDHAAQALTEPHRFTTLAG
jgi:ATP-dependent Lhr-like helicase